MLKRTATALAFLLCFISNSTLPGSAQTAPRNTYSKNFQNMLPPTATSSVDINVVDLGAPNPSIASGSSLGSSSWAAPADEHDPAQYGSPEATAYATTNGSYGQASDYESYNSYQPSSSPVSNSGYGNANGLSSLSYGKVNGGYLAASPATLPGTAPNNGPPAIPIFTCKNGYGWLPQAGANAPIVPGGGINGGPGAIQWTGSWNPASLNQ